MNDIFARRMAQTMIFQQLFRSLPVYWDVTRVTKEKLDVNFVKEEVMRINGRRAMPLLVPAAAALAGVSPVSSVPAAAAVSFSTFGSDTNSILGRTEGEVKPSASAMLSPIEGGCGNTHFNHLNDNLAWASDCYRALVVQQQSAFTQRATAIGRFSASIPNTRAGASCQNSFLDCIAKTEGICSFDEEPYDFIATTTNTVAASDTGASLLTGSETTDTTGTE